MVLRLILGGAGSGKTHRISEMIKEEHANGCGRGILLVPEQETVMRERALLKLLPSSAQLDFEVLNFTRLANSVARKYGGLTYNYVTPGVKQLAVWNNLRLLSPLLSEYSRQEGDTAFAEMMLSQIEEFKAYGVSPTALERAAKNAKENSRTKAKLNDLALIYSAYSASIEQYGAGDPSDDIGRMAKKLSEHNYFEGMRVYIDSFTSFTSSEEQVIYHILRGAEETVISLCLPCDGAKGGMQFESIAQTLKRLERLAEKAGVEIETEFLAENRRTATPSLIRLSKDIWRFGEKDGEKGQFDDSGVRLLKCTNVYEEAEAVTGCVSSLVREGMRYRDIVILARDVKSWEGIIDQALEKADIPYFMSKITDITAVPLAKLILCALRIKNKGWRAEDVIAYIKTGLTGVEERAADLFEQYIWKWNIKGNAFFGDDFTMDPDSYSAEPSKRSQAVLDKVNEARRAVCAPLLRLFEKIDEAESNKDICRGVFEYMEELNIAGQMSEFASVCELGGDKREANETRRLYNTILDVLGIIAEFDPDDGRYESTDFEQALRIVFSKTGLGAIPTSCDEVSIGEASLFRADNPKCVILIGVNEGSFPANVEDVGILTDEDKEFLRENGIELSPTSDGRFSEELFYVYRAVCAPSEKLIMTYSASELQGGKEQRPSLAFNRARLLLGLDVENYSNKALSERLFSEKVAFEYTALAEGEEGNALFRYFSENEEYSERLRELYIPIGERKCLVDASALEGLFGNNVSFSPSAIESYVKCHFNYWCEYVLRLKKQERNVFSISDTGSLIHALLEKFIKLVTDENGFNAKRAEDEADEIIDALMEEYIRENFPERDVERAQVVHVVNKLRHITRLVAKNITAELKGSRFKPEYFELPIDSRDPDAVKPLEFELSDGSKMSVRGIVDRVDLLREGSDVYVKVVDYKTGSKEFDVEDVQEGLNLQMLLYLFSICDRKENKVKLGCRGELKPAGVVYLSTKVSGITEKSGYDKEKLEKDAEDKLVRSGILLNDEKIRMAVHEDIKYVMSGYGPRSRKSKDVCFKSEEEFATIKDTLSESLKRIFKELKSGCADIEPKPHGGSFPCEYCGMKALCRRGHIKREYEDEDEDFEGGED